MRKKTGAICNNYGISGTRIARQKTPSVIAEFDLDFCGRFQKMDPVADIVIVMGGTNDFGSGDAPFGSMNDRTPDTFYGALHYLYIGLIERYPNADIFIVTPTHCLTEDCLRGIGSKKQDMGTLYDYVNMIRQVAEYYALPVIDLFAYGRIQPKLPILKEKYTVEDGLHPNDRGHEEIADQIILFLRLY